MKLYRMSYIFELFCLVLIIAGCSSDEISSPLPDDGEIKPGDPVMFTTHLPGKGQTRTIVPDGNFTGYSAAENDYAITIEMYKSGGTKIGNDGNYITANNDGTLVVAPSGSQLYWPDNVNEYGFKATAGTTTLGADQHTKKLFISQDQLLGYAFVPLKDGEALQYNENALNYKTSKQWKTANANFGVVGSDNQKIIPLYLKHKRSRITVILKAGDGVRREELVLNAASTNIAATIYSYGTSDLYITPYAYEELIESVYYTHYTAIVEPHNYTSQNIVTINLSGQSVTFSGSYDISTAGKHLILTLTLTRADSFKVLVTAQVTNWVDDETTKTLDDFNQEIN